MTIWALSHSLLTSFSPPQSSGQVQAQTWLNKFISKRYLQKVSFPTNSNTSCIKCANFTKCSLSYIGNLFISEDQTAQNQDSFVYYTHFVHSKTRYIRHIKNSLVCNYPNMDIFAYVICILLFVFLSLLKTMKQGQTIIHYSQRQSGN